MTHFWVPMLYVQNWRRPQNTFLIDCSLIGQQYNRNLSQINSVYSAHHQMKSALMFVLRHTTKATGFPGPATLPTSLRAIVYTLPSETTSNRPADWVSPHPTKYERVRHMHNSHGDAVLSRLEPLGGVFLSRHFSSRATVSKTSANTKTLSVLVAIGRDYSPFKDPDVLNMDRTDLLKAIKADDLYANAFKDDALANCAVTIITAVAGEEPSAAEEAAGLPLELGDTVGMLAQACPLGAPLFILGR
jgi:hypothetical protein